MMIGAAVLIVSAILLNHQVSSATTRLPGTALYVAARGHQATVTLADGTIVSLAPETKLRIHTLASGARTADLDGQAIFTVAHAATHPFVVQTGDGAIRVLGTTFGVRHYLGDPVTQVAVREGKVAMNAIALTAGDLGELRADGTVTVLHHANLESVLGWRNGTLVFRNTPLSDIVAQLSRWYDVDVVLADPSLSTIPFTLTIRQELLSDVLVSIERAAGLHVTQHGQIVTISPATERK
jgi:ferric-dicitrate binding protein FerR (iron transport regulator)